MKNNKGVTLTSLLIYVIGMTITVATIATLTSFFYKNIDIGDINIDTTQYTKFSSIFTREINRENNSVVECKSLEDGTNYIIFSSGNQYTYDAESKSIYRNSVKICNNVDVCNFSYIFVDSKYQITVDFKTESIDMSGENAITYII